MSGRAQTTILAPKTFRFTDVDQFRSWIRTVDVDFTPLARKIQAEQIILNLPGFDINFIKSFPRIVEARLAPNATHIGFMMDGGVPIRVNGAEPESERPAIAIGSHGALGTTVERGHRQYTALIFTPAITNRGWPEATRYFKVFETSFQARERLRQLVWHSLRAHRELPDPLDASNALPSIRESFLAAIDAAFAEVIPAKWTSSTNAGRQFNIFQESRDLIAANIGSPIYSSELAQQLGVSVRTIHDAVLRYRGMSLHRYLRLRRLWLVRRRLLVGAESVKACALAFGFWHMGDFSHSYRMQFGETPSQTMARGRKA